MEPIPHSKTVVSTKGAHILEGLSAASLNVAIVVAAVRESELRSYTDRVLFLLFFIKSSLKLFFIFSK